MGKIHMVELGRYQWQGWAFVAYMNGKDVICCCGFLCRVVSCEQFDGGLALGKIERVFD